jgi:hypothetical protein
MPEFQDWTSLNNQESKRSTGGINNLKLESGKTYEVRFIGSPLKFHKYFVAGKSAICENPETCTVKKKYNIEPGVRYAVNVIDRADKQLKILECPPSVLKPVASWGARRKQDPGGANGCDFSISVTGQKKMTRYEVVPLDITPLTDEEKEYCRANHYDLNKLFKPTPDTEIEARLFGGGTAVPATANAPATKPEPVAAGAGENKGGVELPF